MFIPKTSLIAKRYELEKLKQGNLSVNGYEQRFRELCQYASHMSSETRRCRLFEKGLREEIRTLVATSMFTSYARCVESARAVEMTTSKPKPKPKKTQNPKVKVEEMTKDSKQWNKNGNGKHPWNKGNNSGNQSWKKTMGDANAAQGGTFEGSCYKCRQKGHKTSECPNPYVESPKGDG